MKKPVYIYVTPFFPSPDNWRGAYGYDFVKALMATGRFQVEVFMEGPGYDYEVKGIHVHVFKAFRLPSNVFPFLARKRNQDKFISSVKRAGISLSDVAICHGNTANYGIYPLALKKVVPSCKTVLHHHDLASFGLNIGCLHRLWIYNLMHFGIFREMHEQMDVHVFISEACRRSFLTAPDTSWTLHSDYKHQMRWLTCRPVRIKKSLILHNGVDKELFYSSLVLRQEHKVFTIGCVANFQPIKDHITLFQALTLLKEDHLDVRLICVGSGVTRKSCECYAVKHGLDVEFRTEVAHEDLPMFYRSLDLFVLPSYFEGFGCVYTEAHACGVPFIACRGQGIQDILPDGEQSRWLVDPMNSEALACRIKDYYQHRWKQVLNEDQDINTLVRTYLGHL